MLDPVQRSHRFLELDAVRGIAAFAVVLAHFDAALGSSSGWGLTVACHVLGSGAAAVIFFFLLSGFVLTGPYLGPRHPTYPSFLIKRICRIYLPYAAAILLAAALAARLFSTVPTGNFWIDQTWSKPFSAHLLLQHLIMVGHYDNTRLNTAIWSLIIEMRISLVFPLIPWIATRVKPFLTILLFAPLTLLLAYLADRTAHALVFETLFFGMIFLLGSLLRTHYAAIRHFLEARTRLQTTALLAFALVCYQGAEFLPLNRFHVRPELSAFLVAWCIAAAATVFLLLATTSRTLRHLLHGRVLLWAGARSYSIYLLHATVLFTLIRLHPQGPIPLAWFPIYLAITLALGEIFHRFVEIPTTALGRKLAVSNA